MTNDDTGTSAQERRRQRAAMVLAQLIVVVVTAADVITKHDVVLVGLLINAPLLHGLVGTPARTRNIGLEVFAIAVASCAWNDNIERWTYWVPLTVVSLGAAFGWLVAKLRGVARQETQRMRVLAQVAMVAEEQTHTADVVAGRIARVLVPSLARACAIHVLTIDGTTTSVAREGADAAPDAEQDLVDDVVASRRPEIRELRGEAAGALAGIPLIARGRPLGVLTLDARDGFGEGDLEYLTTLAGRVALAVDNAALSTELSSTERQLRTIMQTVDVAITVRDMHGRMLYANQAAADLLRLPDPAAVQAAPPGELMDRFEVYTEEGLPVALEDLPGTRLLRGDPDPPDVVVRNIVRATGEERWLLNKASAVRDDAGRALMAINLIEDITEHKRSEIAQRILAEAGRHLAAAGDLGETLQAIADMAVPALADWAGVDLVERRGVHTVAVAHRDPAKVQLGWRLRREWPPDVRADRGLMRVLRTGMPELLPEITEEMLIAGAQDPEHLALLRELGLNSAMIVPMLAGTEVIGALSFVSSTARRFDDRDLRLALDLGREAGVALKNARLNQERADIAQTLQRSLVPGELPEVPGWTLAAAYRPAGELIAAGGDFYDAFPFGDRWAVVIGDVAGKGAAAAAVTALVRHRIAGVMDATGDAEQALRRLNAALQQDGNGASGRLCSVAILVVESDCRVTLFNAGHPLPVHVHDGRAAVTGRPGLLLGAREEIEIGRHEIRLQPGDRIVLYTDGVLDATGADERFGEHRLLAALSTNAPAVELPGRVVAEIDDFLVGDQPDDIALLVLECAPRTRDERPPSTWDRVADPAAGSVRGR